MKIRKVTTILFISSLVLSVAGCGKIKSLFGGGEEEAPATTVQESGGQAEEDKAADTKAADTKAAEAPQVQVQGAAQQSEKDRFIMVATEVACTSVTDPGKVAEVTKDSMKMWGFTEESYAQASAKYLADPEVKSMVDAAKAACAGQKDAATKEGEKKVDETASKDGEKGEAKKEEKKKPEPAPTAGKWKGSITGKYAGTLNFTVSFDGKKITRGKVKAADGTFFIPNMRGTIAGNRITMFAKIGRKTGDRLMFSGTIRGKKASGTWQGTVASRPARGSWTATK